MKPISIPEENARRCQSKDDSAPLRYACTCWDYEDEYPHLSDEEIAEMRAHNRRWRERNTR